MEVERFGTDLVRKQSIKTIDSREVAEMMEVPHYKILRKLDGDKDRKGYIEILSNAQMGVSKYFIESNYKDNSGKENKCYLFTKMGCEFIANKFTGEKGILFTAKYVEKFNKMEQAVQKPASAFDILELQFKALKEVKNQLNQVNKNALKAKKDLEDFKEDIPLFNVECDELQSIVRKKGIEVLGGKKSIAYKDKSLRTKVYVDIQHQIKREFGLCSYKAIKRGQLDIAKKIVNDYRAPIVLVDQIEVLNSQLNLKV